MSGHKRQRRVLFQPLHGDDERKRVITDWPTWRTRSRRASSYCSFQGIVDKWTSLYAATSEMHEPEKYGAVSADKQVSARGIEVGHIFYFGTKYSEPMKAVVAGPDGKEVLLHGGSYGIGPSRLVAAIIEACHDENGIKWPEPVAPFDVIILNLKQGDAATDAASEQLYKELSAKGLDVLYHDTDERPGAKFATADLIGIPWQILVGPKARCWPGRAEAPGRREPHHARPG